MIMLTLSYVAHRGRQGQAKKTVLNMTGLRKPQLLPDSKHVIFYGGKASTTKRMKLAL